MEATTPTEPRIDTGMINSKEVVDPMSVPPGSTRFKMDRDHLFDIVGIIGTVLNLLVVVLVYIYTHI